MSLKNHQAFALNEFFRAIVRASVTKAAISITSEVWVTGKEILHGKRYDLAQKVINDWSSVEDKFAWSVAIADITNDSTDLDMDNRISAIWNAMAGVKQSEL